MTSSTNITNMKPEELLKLQEELSALKAKEAKRIEQRKAYMEKTKEARADYNERRRVRQSILLKKAEAAGLKVSEKEIDEALAKMNK